MTSKVESNKKSLTNNEVEALRLRVMALESELEDARISAEDALLQAEGFAQEATDINNSLTAKRSEFEAFEVEAEIKLSTTKDEIQSLKSELQTTTEKLETTNEELETTNEELEATNEELKATNTELEQRAESARHISEANYKRATEIARLGHWFWDNTTNKPGHISVETAAIFGLTPEEFKDKISNFENFLNLVHPDDREAYKKTDLSAFRDMSRYEIIYRLLLPSNIVRHVKEIGEGVFDNQGQLIQTVGTVLDVSDVFDLEQGLAERDIQIEQALTLAGMGTWILDSINQEYEYVSQKLAEIFGYSIEEYLTLSRNETQSTFRVHPDDVAQHSEFVNSYEQRGEGYQATYRIIRKDGLVRTIRETNQPVFDASGKTIKHIGCLQDITNFMQIEDALRKSESRLTEILDIAPEAVITIGEDMNIQLFNQGAERIFGYSSAEVLGQSMEILMPERLRQRHHRYITGFHESKDTYRLMDQREEISGLRKDGSEFPASASVSKLEISGEVIFTVMMSDITERRRADEDRRMALTEAEKANQAKSDFLAAMSHELRTPLNAILGFADILRYEYLGPLGGKKYAEYAHDIHASGDHLLSLVDDILDISSIEAGEMVLHKELIPIDSIVTESMEIVANNADTKGVELTKKIFDELPPLYADRRSVRQILLNLLGNAIKFTPAGGNITLSAKSSGRNISLRITDTGIGISNEKLPGLTKPFTRAERDPHKAVEGWGLGLAITKSLIDLHMGSIDIESAIGKGTTVTITLPNVES
jgi:PAS domain S-box-containing protein